MLNPPPPPRGVLGSLCCLHRMSRSFLFRPSHSLSQGVIEIDNLSKSPPPPPPPPGTITEDHHSGKTQRDGLESGTITDYQRD